MDQKTPQIMRSKKAIKLVEPLVKSRKYLIPKEAANDTDKELRPSVRIMVNGKTYMYPVEIFTEIDYVPYCVLRDIGFFDKYYVQEITGEIDPLREKKVYE